MKKVAIILVVILLIIAGVFAYNHISTTFASYEKQIAELTDQNGQMAIDLAKAQKDYMEMSSKSKTTTQIVYVEKDSPDDADFEVNKAAPKVVINAGDGQSYEYTPDTHSYQSIENGKMVLNEENVLQLDIEKIVDARFKDKTEAILSKHELEIKQKDEEITQLQDKLSITKKQRDFYGAIAGAGVIGAAFSF